MIVTFQSRRKAWLWAGLLALLSAPSLRADTDPVEILRRSVEREAKASYVGMQETTVTGARGVQRTVQRVRHRAPDKHRVDYLQPARLRGNLILDDGRRTWHYLRALNVVEQRPSRSRAARQMARRIAQAVRLGKTRVEYLGEESVAGRKASGVRITAARSSDRTREVWLDQEHGVALRVREIGPAGRVSDAAFREIRFNVPVPEADFAWSPPPGASVVSRSDGRPIPLLRAQQVAKRWGGLRLPRYLPPGFERRTTHELRFAGQPVIHLRFSGGGRTFSLFQGLAGAAPGERPVSSAGAKKHNVLPFKRGRVNLLIVGPLPPEELRKIADSVE